MSNKAGDRRRYRDDNEGLSGSKYDRWAYEHSAPGSNDTTLNKLQHRFWVTRQAVTRKLGKDEDVHVVASDAELDAKLELYRSIQDTTFGLQVLIEHYQDRICALAFEEHAFGRLLKEHGKSDRTRAGKMMLAVGRTMVYSGQQRVGLRVPLVRLYQEVNTFKERAIEDTLVTVKAMEKARTSYRGALMWMKNVSQELDPDTYRQLEKFRKVQAHVKLSKAKFDQKKLDCLQKIDLLAASRCNMFSHALIVYQDTLISFWERTSRTMSQVSEAFKGYQHYDFTFLKDLAEPKTYDKEKEKKDDDKAKAIQTNENRDDQLIDVSEDFSTNERAGPSTLADAFPQLLDLDTGNATKEEKSNVNEKNNKEEKERKESNTLLDFGDDNDDEDNATDSLQSLAASMVRPSLGTMLEASEADTALLEELMGDSVAREPVMTMTTETEDEFSSFIASRSVVTSEEEEKKRVETRKDEEDRNFLPSHLFDLSHEGAADVGLDDRRRLDDFPMPSPSRPSLVQRQTNRKEKKNDRSQWFNLFADLDPLSNPDAIGKTTKDEDNNCYG